MMSKNRGGISGTVDADRRTNFVKRSEDKREIGVVGAVVAVVVDDDNDMEEGDDGERAWTGEESV